MNLSDEIQRLHDLHAAGALTDAEFAQAKASVLSGAALVPQSDSAAVEAQLSEIKFQNELACVDREWNLERESYMSTGKYGSRSAPTASAGLVSCVVGVAFMILTISIGAPFILPLFALVFIGQGIYFFIKASAYQDALQKYEANRAEMISKHRRLRDE